MGLDTDEVIAYLDAIERDVQRLVMKLRQLRVDLTDTDD